MYTTKVAHKYIVFSDDSVFDALKKINENKARIVFVVSEDDVLLGSVSDGDVRRWITNGQSVNLDVRVSHVMNPDPITVKSSDPKSSYSQYFLEGIDCLPVVDDVGHLVQLVFKKYEGFLIGDREISESTPSFIIAEIGNNHQGDLGLAKRLVDYAVMSGADCAKFQMRNVKELYQNSGNSNDASVDLGAQYTMELLEKYQLSNEQLYEVFDYCKAHGILPLCTPWDRDSLDALECYGMPAYKVASADFTNYELLEAIANTGKPLICSTGMSSETEIRTTVEYLDGLGANYVLLHCNSTYPTPYKDVNLKYISRLKKITAKLVGYSGHERGIVFPIAAVALGACVVEKHLTTDQSLEGTDHKVSLLPDEFADMVRQIRNIEEGLGSDISPRQITQGEMINRENLAKSLVARVSIKKGEVISRDAIIIKSPGQGVQPNRLEELVGKIAHRDIDKGGYFFESDITGGVRKRSNYAFMRPFGVPVRYHDYRQIIDSTNLDFVEFHLSYKDLEIDLSTYFGDEESIGFAVHSPELFSGDHILDLSADEEVYRKRSIAELSGVMNITRGLKKYFPMTDKPVVVVNAGGWDRRSFIDPVRKPEKYRKIGDALAQIDASGVQVAIQTMPPFPWHFGGQSYHNLFVSADEIVDFCNEYKDIKICLDVSHTMMACNYYGWDLYGFIEKISPHVVHMHIADAKGIDGEGVESGKGDVDFSRLSSVLGECCKEIQFIPEIWQGHKNGGEGFWRAFDFLEKYKF